MGSIIQFKNKTLKLLDKYYFFVRKSIQSIKQKIDLLADWSFSLKLLILLCY